MTEENKTPPAPPAPAVETQVVADFAARKQIRDQQKLIQRLAKSLQEHGIGHTGAGAPHEELDQIRIDAGDAEHEAHVLLRNWQRAEHNFNGHDSSDKGTKKQADELEKALAAIAENPLASERHAKILKARKERVEVEF